MTFTVGSFTADVRKITRDTNSANYVHTDAEICRATVDAFRKLFSTRPETRYADGVLRDVVFPTTDAELAAFAVDVDERYRVGIVYFSAARCYEMDVTDSVNRELAQTYFARAEQEFAK